MRISFWVLWHTRRGEPRQGQSLAAAIPSSISAAISIATSVKAARLDRRHNGQVGLAGRKDGEKTILSFAGAGRLDAIDALEGKVEQAAFAAVSGRERVGNAGADDLLGSGLCGKAEFLRAKGLEIVGVKADEVVFALVETQHLRGDRLEGAEQFAIVLGHERDIGSAELNINLASLEALRVARAVAGGDAVFEAQAAQFIEGGKESGNFLSSVLQVGNRHNGLVSQNRAGAGTARRERVDWVGDHVPPPPKADSDSKEFSVGDGPHFQAGQLQFSFKRECYLGKEVASSAGGLRLGARSFFAEFLSFELRCSWLLPVAQFRATRRGARRSFPMTLARRETSSGK